ncbi:MAG: glutamate synthase large subunit [Candidatus Poribacteria bacterium]|nr:glutamate synthase large subunit [Candidatus Poribacteria bacterium]
MYNDLKEKDACGVGFIANRFGSRSHEIIKMATQAVTNLTHRGAVAADAKTGDGAGILTQIPEKLFQKELEKLGVHLDSINDIGVGMIFLPRHNRSAQAQGRALVEKTLQQYGVPFRGWRSVPLDLSALGTKALETMPEIQQVLVERPEQLTDDAFERRLYLICKELEHRITAAGLDEFHIASFSHRTIVYKGLLVAPQLSQFYLDLKDPDFEAALAVFHQRYSTNTSSTWMLAQPFHTLAHNGEINTLMGNRNWMRAREADLQSPLWNEHIQKLVPIINPHGSDSMSLDSVLELLTHSDRDILHAMMCLIPEAYEQISDMPDVLKACYEYLSCVSEPWDGPAAVAFTDGVVVGASLDRNGLRPARYKVTEDGTVVMGSEVGIIELDDSCVVEKGRLGPGQMIAVDTAQGKLLKDSEIKHRVAEQKPYAEWVQKGIVTLPTEKDGASATTETVPEQLPIYQKAFGYMTEDVERFIKPMVTEAKEAVGSMGDDTPPAVISQHPRLLYNYFKQRFAQVTNPPIDSIRERLVMSLTTYLGRRHSLLTETEAHARLIRLPSPILTNTDLQALRELDIPDFQIATLSVCFPVSSGKQGLETALETLCQRVSESVDAGTTLLVLSDKDVNPNAAPIPMALAVGAVHHHLIREGKRMRVSLIAETGDAREEHHFAVLIGYGAAAVNPYLAFSTIVQLAEDDELAGLTAAKAVETYKATVEKGILKIMAKMGISTVSSYRGAQIFEALGINTTVIDKCFTGTTSRLNGIGFAEIAAETLHFHTKAFSGNGDDVSLEEAGYFRFRRNGEFHAYNPTVFKSLHKFVKAGKSEDYEKYVDAVETGEPSSLRDLLAFKASTPIPIEEVEPAEDIVRRFTTGSMSFGALSRETHETLAIAMNRLGAKSGSGEGGESPKRFKPQPNGDLASSAIKQVASGRFGVTPTYLISARELEIKMAQGSKPGEGGQIPGHKVTAEIASIRHSVPGVPLISPPPHHDIYSIEDLAQLIYDLKQANPRAKVAVKLVSEFLVGTIASGVAKGYADVIQVSGHEGGTGASPLSSIKNAGTPWELGIAETQRALVENELRDRVVLRADGGMRSGRDIIIAAMLGAEEYGFGTIAMVATGCVMARQCHLNTCPVGVATQDPALRAKYPGTPEMVVNFMLGVANEVRAILANLGHRSLNDIIGRPELLQPIDLADYPKAAMLDLSEILTPADPTGTQPRYHLQERNDREDIPLDDQILADAEEAIDEKTSIQLSYAIRNTHRTVGAKLSGEIARRYGDAGLPDRTIQCHLEGSAGQSFGAFCISGVQFVLTGEANDYVGKGMAGGELIIKPAPTAPFRTYENTIIGNTVLYGATGGTLYAAGGVGERFCVRNSGATAVVESVGDHGCEYMTAGTVIILGETGRNFGAGMTGGTAYVLDEKGQFEKKYNPDWVNIEKVTGEADIKSIMALIQNHATYTGSQHAENILANWQTFLPHFWKVVTPPPPPLPAPVQLKRRAASRRERKKR